MPSQKVNRPSRIATAFFTMLRQRSWVSSLMMMLDLFFHYLNAFISAFLDGFVKFSFEFDKFLIFI
jgi:hypothetical protein